MGLRSVTLLGLFVVGLVAAFANPIWGVLCYLGHYYVFPENQWWGQVLQAAGVRTSLTISAVLGLAFLMHWNRLRHQWSELLHSQEILFWLYVVVIGVGTLWAGEYAHQSARARPPFEKMYKVGIFLFIFTHVAVTWRDLQRVLFFIVTFGGAYLAWVAWTLPSSHYVDGRLEGIGGPDFLDSNFLATHFIGAGIFTGTLLLIRKGLIDRFGLLAAGALIANAVILTRSRGAFLGMAAAIGAGFVLADAHLRRKAFWLLPLIAIGGYSLVDDHFLERLGTIFAEQDERDASAQSRLDVWDASVRMFLDHPLGVGPDQFFNVIGSYDARYAGRDTHSTYFRCLAELGIPGILILAALFLNAFRILGRCRRMARELPDGLDLHHAAFGMQLALIAFAVSGLTITMCYSEGLFHILLLPVCLHRVIANRWSDYLAECELDEAATEDERDWEAELAPHAS